MKRTMKRSLKRRMYRNLVALLLLLISPLLTGAQSSAGSIEGAVFDLVTGAPVPKATLDLQSADTPAVRYPGVTSPDGRFAFRNVAPGRYSLTASRTGYVRSQYGQRGPNGDSATLTIATGQGPADVRMSMVQSGAISGRLIDIEGEPVTEAQVHAWRISYKDGWRVQVPIVSMASNDLGEYRMFGLPPGQYYVSAQAEPPDYIRAPSFGALGPPMPGAVVTSFSAGQGGAGAADPAVQPRRGPRNWAPVYFGSTTDPFAATEINLPAGNEVRNADIVIERIPLALLTGTVVDGSTGAPVRGAIITLTPVAANGQLGASRVVNVTGGRIVISSAASLASSATGGFLAQVAPRGTYLLTAIAQDAQGRRISGQATVDLRDTTGATASIVLAPPRAIAGQVVLDGAASPADLSRVRIGLRSTVAASMDVAQQSVPATGEFSLNGIAAGDYQLNVSAGGDRNYVKAIQLGSLDLLDDGLLSATLPEGPVRVVIGANAGALRGNAVDENGAPLSNVTVVLMPDESRRSRIDLYQSAVTDQAGAYRFDRVPPGSYKLFAWEDVETGTWRNPAFMRLHESRAQAIQINEGGSESANVAVIRLR